MKNTNYSKIADKYDLNQYRIDEIRFDEDLQGFFNHHQQSEYNVLDLSCGTGLYLEKQMKYFTMHNVNWHGLDASEAMLEKAREKAGKAALIHAFAEKMPYESDTFDYISNNYAFHHYQNKEQACNEIHRVLKQGGLYKLHNISIQDMTKWWVYQYFPTAYTEDLNRFWHKEIIFRELMSRGFGVTLRIEYKLIETKLADYLNYAENRDISVLTLLPDKDYEEGVAIMKYEVERNPEKTIINDFAEMFCIAIKI